MDSSGKRKIKKQNPRLKSRSQRINSGFLIPAFISIILLVLIIVFLGRNVDRESVNTVRDERPVIERVEKLKSPREDIEPVTELGEPEKEEMKKEIVAEDKEQRMTTARLFFIKVSGDEGIISLKSVLRPVPESGSPLKTAILSLLDGPQSNEISSGILTLVPENSILIGARLESGTAFLNFNEEFQFNILGIEGYRTQVEQIVYTATEFPTVDEVQFLIEGQRIDYLGGEGFFVGIPLGREDFNG